MTSAVATVRGVSVSLAGRRVVRDVDLDIRPGEILAVVGPNGAGKSTLLAAIAGDLPADSGEILIGDDALRTLSVMELARRRALLPQHVIITFPFTVTDVVRMGRAPWAGTPMEERDGEAVGTAMRQTEVVGLADRPHTQLSGGERARVSLARVLAQETVLLLLDEPTAALDVRHQELVMRLARDRATAGAAVVVVVHDLGLAAAHADRVAILDAGALAAVGPPPDVLEAGLLSRIYETGVEVVAHPRNGDLLVLPWRADRPRSQ